MALSSKIQGGALLLGLPKSIYYKLLCEFTAMRQKSWKKSYNLRWKVVDTMHLTKIKVEAFQTAISGKKEWNRKKSEKQSLRNLNHWDKDLWPFK